MRKFFLLAVVCGVVSICVKSRELVDISLGDWAEIKISDISNKMASSPVPMLSGETHPSPENLAIRFVAANAMELDGPESPGQSSLKSKLTSDRFRSGLTINELVIDRSSSDENADRSCFYSLFFTAESDYRANRMCTLQRMNREQVRGEVLAQGFRLMSSTPDRDTGVAPPGNAFAAYYSPDNKLRYLVMAYQLVP